MNERVWLQSKVTFVNTKQAISLGFLATFLTFSCSPKENSEKTARHQPDPQVQAVENDLPALPIIWESKPASGPIVDLAIGKTASNAYYITAILEDGSAESFDLDGIPIAKSESGLFKEIAAGAPIVVGDTTLLAHVTKSNDGFLSLALASPENQLIGFALLPMVGDASPIDILCPSAVLSADKEIHGGYTRDNQYFEFMVDLSTDTPSYTEKAKPTKNENEQTCSPTSALIQHGNNASSSLTWIDGDNNTLKISQANMNEVERYSLREGMSVSAPQKVTSIGSYSGFVSVDYPRGLIALAGNHADGNAKISFVSAEGILGLPANEDKDSTSPLSAKELRSLQDSLEDNAQQ